MKQLIKGSNYVGIASVTLCVVHCILTPFLIVLVAKFEWWHSLSYLFLAISFWALYEAVKGKPPKHILILLWTSFVVLALCIFLEDAWHYAEYSTYLASLGLVIGHIFNLRYCNHCVHK